MKKFLLVLVLIIPFFSQAQFIANPKSTNSSFKSAYLFEPNDVNAVLNSDQPGSRKMRKGTGMIVTGSIFLGVGTSVLATSDGVVRAKVNESKGNGTSGAANQQAEVGAVLIATGVALFVPGLIVYSKGKKMKNAYETENKVSINLHGAGMKLRWNF